MPVQSPKIFCLQVIGAFLLAVYPGMVALAAEGPTTPEQFALQYIAAFNKKDLPALQKLRYPLVGKSDMQEMMDSLTAAEMTDGTQYSRFELLPAGPDMDKPHMGPDGIFYKSNLKPTNMIKFISETKSGTSSTTFAIGQNDGVFYQVAIEPAVGETPAYQFGWQRVAEPQSNWSVAMPNEPEPGRAALEKQYGKDAFNDPDIYGVVKNTADIKTYFHWLICGEEGKRINQADNKTTYRAACTTYEPETLKKWFADPQKNLDEAVDSCARMDNGELMQQKPIVLDGSPGREFTIANKDGSLTIGRVYWIKDALYKLTVESKQGKPDMTAADKFLASLEVK